jgi:molybdopterin molybdotransferase
MIDVETALGLIDKHMTLPRFGETVQEDLIADRDYPPFHRVMMDGIAVSWNVFKEGKRDFKVAGILAAGVPQGILNDLATCFEVMTGAPLPMGADLVIPYEHLEIKDGLAKVILETERIQMENVHLAGSDAKKGDVLLRAGHVINGPHRGIAASVGVNLMSDKIRINIISTGDELVEVDQIPLDHQIRRSNAHALAESLRLHGFRHIELSHLPDEVPAIEDHYTINAQNFDLMIYSGGVSKGKFDYLPSSWKNLGVTEYFHGISQRPGKPFWFGVDHVRKTTVAGLPGNPVSSLVCLHRYILSQRPMYAQLTEEIIFKKDLTYFIPVKLESDKTGVLKAHPLKIKNSGEFSALAGSDGFLELPKDQSVFKVGEAFLFHPWRPM